MTNPRRPFRLNVGFIIHDEVGYTAEFPFEFDKVKLGDEKEFPVEVYSAPKLVGAAVSAVWKGNRLITPIGGGVHVEPRQAVKSENLMTDEDGRVGELRGRTKVKK